MMVFTNNTILISQLHRDLVFGLQRICAGSQKFVELELPPSALIALIAQIIRICEK